MGMRLACAQLVKMVDMCSLDAHKKRVMCERYAQVKDKESALTVTFRPGDVGAEFEAGGSVTSLVMDGQAQEMGVEVGMRYERLQDDSYSRSQRWRQLQQKVAGRESYKVTFVKDKFREEVLNNFTRSTALRSTVIKELNKFLTDNQKITAF